MEERISHEVKIVFHKLDDDLHEAPVSCNEALVCNSNCTRIPDLFFIPCGTLTMGSQRVEDSHLYGRQHMSPL